MRGAAIAFAHAPWASAHVGSPAVNWVAVISVTISSVAIIFAIASTVAGRRRRRQRKGDDDDGDFRAGGGPGGPGPDTPRGSDGDPAWWPEFEREFAAYVAEAAPHRYCRA